MPRPFPAPWLLLTLFASFSVSFAAPPKDTPASFKIVVKVKVRDQVVNADVLFHGDHVLTITDNKLEAVFHLKEMWWHYLETGRRMNLEECKEWHLASNKKLRDSLAEAPEEARPFIEALIDPRFKVEDKDGALVMTNNISHYTMHPLAKLPEPFAPKVAGYNLLNAHATAIVESQLPPDSALAITAELAHRKVYATKTLATVKTPKEVLKFDVTMQLHDLTADELKLVTTTVAKLKQ
jgi:hypothetical protein